MTGLIQKSGYIKPGSGGGHYAEYIATRDGVELIKAPQPSHQGGGYLEYMAERHALTVCFPQTAPPIWRKPWRRSTGIPGQCGPSSTP